MNGNRRKKSSVSKKAGVTSVIMEELLQGGRPIRIEVTKKRGKLPRSCGGGGKDHQKRVFRGVSEEGGFPAARGSAEEGFLV